MVTAKDDWKACAMVTAKDDWKAMLAVLCLKTTLSSFK